MDEKIKELEQAISEARKALAEAEGADRQALEVNIGQKSDALAKLKAQQQQAYANEHEELIALRREKENMELERIANAAAEQFKAGLKAAQDERKAEIAQVFQEQIRKVLGEQTVSIQGLVAETLPDVLPDVLTQYRAGRKFAVDNTAETREGVAGGAAGRKAQQASVEGDGFGQPDNFTGFCAAIVQRDATTIARMQRKHGIQVGKKAHYGAYMGPGGKALVEGGGWVDATAGPSGGYVVPVEYVNQIIPGIYAAVVLTRAGCRRLPMTSPSLRQPALTGAATAQYVGETAPITDSQETFGLFSLLAKELTALVPVSRTLLQDANPAMDAIVREDMSRVMALKMDSTMLTATGSSTVPQGILTQTGTTQIAVVGTNGDAPTYDMVVAVITALRKTNVPRVNWGWVGAPDMISALARVKDSNGRPIFTEFMNPQQSTMNPQGAGGVAQAGPDGTLMGIPFYASTSIPLGTTGTGATSTLALVEFNQVVIGELGEMELDVSTEGTYIHSGTTIPAWQDNLAIFRAIMRHDVNQRFPQACVVRNGVVYS